MMQYGRSNIGDNELNDISKNIMKNEDEKKKIIDQLYDKKTLDYYKKSFTLKSKKISYDDFVKLASKKGYRSRAAFKLLEIQKKDRLILQCSSLGYIPYTNLLNQTLIYVQHAPEPVQASLESPEIFASKIIQLIDGGIDFIIVKSIKRVKIALKFVVFTFLFKISRTFFFYFFVISSIFLPCSSEIKYSISLFKYFGFFS